jgi:hypothetical protein
VEEDRRGEAHRVEPVEHAAVASIMWPQSLTPRSRLIADITRPPKKPMSVTTSAMPPATSGVKGVIHHSAAPIAEADSTPPAKPSTVLDGDSSGATRVRPNSLPHTYCSTSLICTMNTRKHSSSALRPA